MRKFLISIFIFFSAVLVVDFGFGLVCRYFITHAKCGDTKSCEYIAHECDEDILIFGSSRAINHYVPIILSDSLGLSCYNCGMDGNGVLLMYCRFLMISNRYTPKVIIYDVTVFDIINDAYTKNLGWQKRYCNECGVMDVIADINPNERLKLKSNLYRYNSFFVQMATNNFVKMRDIDKTGYAPNYGTMDYDVSPSTDTLPPIKWDPLMKKYFEKLVNECRQKGILLVVAYSPMHLSVSSAEYDEITQYCTEQKIPLLDYYSHPVLSRKKEFFKDSYHLNDDGAREYTKAFASEIKDILKSENIVL